MWTISIHMEDKWQHKLNIAKWKSKDARSELKAVSKQTNRQKRNKLPLWQLTFWDSYLPASGTFPKADLHICTAVAHTSLAPVWLFFPLRNLSIREVTPVVLNFCLLVDLCISSFSLPHALGKHKPKQLSCYSFPQCRMHLFYHGPKSAAPNLTIAFLALLANFCHFLTTKTQGLRPLGTCVKLNSGHGTLPFFFRSSIARPLSILIQYRFAIFLSGMQLLLTSAGTGKNQPTNRKKNQSWCKC